MKISKIINKKAFIENFPINDNELPPELQAQFEKYELEQEIKNKQQKERHAQDIMEKFEQWVNKISTDQTIEITNNEIKIIIQNIKDNKNKSQKINQLMNLYQLTHYTGDVVAELHTLFNDIGQMTLTQLDQYIDNHVSKWTRLPF